MKHLSISLVSFHLTQKYSVVMNIHCKILDLQLMWSLTISTQKTRYLGAKNNAQLLQHNQQFHPQLQKN